MRAVGDGQTAKNFLQACWRLREALVGKLRVEHRVLIHEPGRGEVQGDGATAWASK